MHAKKWGYNVHDLLTGGLPSKELIVHLTTENRALPVTRMQSSVLLHCHCAANETLFIPNRHPILLRQRC